VKALVDHPAFNIALFALLLSLPWEFGQMWLHAGASEMSHLKGIQICVAATGGDAVNHDGRIRDHSGLRAITRVSSSPQAFANRQLRCDRVDRHDRGRDNRNPHERAVKLALRCDDAGNAVASRRDCATADVGNRPASRPMVRQASDRASGVADMSVAIALIKRSPCGLLPLGLQKFT
jgi:hypothetical protein